jgi:hypothetical protein
MSRRDITSASALTNKYRSNERWRGTRNEDEDDGPSWIDGWTIGDVRLANERADTYLIPARAPGAARITAYRGRLRDSLVDPLQQLRSYYSHSTVRRLRDPEANRTLSVIAYSSSSGSSSSSSSSVV